jgi:competence protein ComEC
MADMEKEVVGIGPVNYIKVNHHGSKNGLTEDEILSTMPKIAVISVGKNNTYGHPHQEILDILQKSNVLTYRTDLDGNVEVVTNGKEFWKYSK